MDTSSSKNKAREGFYWLISSTALGQLISWGLTLVTARTLTPFDYGVLALGETLSPYLLIISTCALENWLLQKKTILEAQERAVSYLLVSVSTFVTTLAMVVAPFLADFYNEPSLTRPFQLLALTFLLRASQLVPEARFRREMDFKSLSKVTFVLNIVRGALQLVLAIFGFHYWSLAIGSVVRELLYSLYLNFRRPVALRGNSDWSEIHDALRFGGAVFLSTILWVVFSTSDNLVVGRLFGTEVLGFYAMAYFLADLPVGKLNGVLAPYLAAYYSRLDKEAIPAAFLRTSRLTFSVLAPTYIGIAAVADIGVEAVLGQRWLPLVRPLQVMCFLGLTRAAMGIASPLFYSQGKPRYPLTTAGLNAAILPLCFYVFGKRYGLEGILLTWTIVYPMTGGLLYLIFVNRLINMPLRRYFRTLLPSLSCAAVMGLAVYSLRAPLNFSAPIQLAILATTGSLLYIILLWMASPQVFAELSKKPLPE